jgi:parallel beta-helix repeat protein
MEQFAQQSRWISIVVLTAAALVTALNAGATDYYLSESIGNDSWSGLLPDPNGTMTDGPKQSLGAAAGLLDNVALPGDRVLLRRGDTWSGDISLTLSSAAGTIAQPIVIGAYGSGAAPTLDRTFEGTIITVRGDYTEPASQYLRFENLRLTTTAAPGDRPIGVLILESYRPIDPHHITFADCEIDHLKHGLTWYEHGHVLERCHIHDNYGIAPETGHTQGIYVSGTDMTIRDSLFVNNGKPDSWFDHNLYISHGSGYVIEGNTIRSSLDGIKLRGSNDTVVRDNVIHDMNLGAISVGGDDSGPVDNVIIERNLVYDTVDAITVKSQSGTQLLPSTNIIIRNNIFHSNRGTAPIGGDYAGYVNVLDPVEDVSLCNNLIVNISDPNERNLYIYAANPANLQIKNNIFMRTDATRPMVEFPDASSLAATDLDHNLYHYPGGEILRVDGTDYQNLAAFRLDHPSQEAGGVEGDPILAGPFTDFHLTITSELAIDTGAPMPITVDGDFDGLGRPIDGDLSGVAEWDIGPYEYSPGIFADGFESGDLSFWTATKPRAEPRHSSIPF